MGSVWTDIDAKMERNNQTHSSERLTFASYNVQGINAAKWPYLRDIFDACDFLLLQET